MCDEEMYVAGVRLAVTGSCLQELNLSTHAGCVKLHAVHADAGKVAADILVFLSLH
jgi:hypothetical protein